MICSHQHPFLSLFDEYFLTIRKWPNASIHATLTRPDRQDTASKTTQCLRRAIMPKLSCAGGVAVQWFVSAFSIKKPPIFFALYWYCLYYTHSNPLSEALKSVVSYGQWCQVLNSSARRFSKHPQSDAPCLLRTVGVKEYHPIITVTVTNLRSGINIVSLTYCEETVPKRKIFLEKACDRNTRGRS